jgi:predicted MPP superfamily phosphohydrolase
MLIRFLILLAFLLLIDVYFFQAIKTIAADWSELKTTIIFRTYWAITIFSVVFGIFTIVTYQHPILPKFVYLYTMCLLFIFVISKLVGSLFLMIDDVQRLIQWMVSLFYQKNTELNAVKNGISRAKFLSYGALSLAAIPLVSMIYGMIKTAFDFTIRREKIILNNLPDAFNGLKIIQISDIHSGSFASGDAFKKAVEMINAEKPDVIFFTGDLVNDRSDEAEPFVEIWKDLKAEFGIYSTLGNHDYGDYVQWDSVQLKKQNLERLKEIHQEMGWDLLMNEHRILTKEGASIGILGVENWGAALRFPRKGDMKKAKLNMPEVPVKLLLSHDPSHWKAQITKHHQDIDVAFAGHTHGFQFGIEIPGFKWSPSQYVYKQWAGLYSEGNQHIYVNRGLGFLGYLGRVGIKPEISVIELHNGKSIVS